MSEQPRPVRAWAEYDEWSVYAEDDFDGEKHSPFWAFWTPKTGDYAHDDSRAKSVLHVIELSSDDFMDCGPLRTLRVLLSTGHWVELVRKADSVTIPQGRKAVMLDPGCMKFSLFASEGAWLHGGWYMPEVTDADAVARAISEALAWIREQE